MGPWGSRCEDIVDSCRLQVLTYFGADPGEYDVVFTAGSTAALKVVAECFPWSPPSALVYPFNAHTSVLGMRDFAPSAYCVPSRVFHKVDSETSSAKMPENGGAAREQRVSGEDEEEEDGDVFYSLLAVPGECNFSGVPAHCSQGVEIIVCTIIYFDAYRYENGQAAVRAADATEFGRQYRAISFGTSNTGTFSRCSLATWCSGHRNCQGE